jgi:hypothetical protein
LSSGTSCGAAATKKLILLRAKPIPKHSSLLQQKGIGGIGFYYARYCMKIFRTLSINFIDRKEIIANDFSSQEQAAWFSCI